MRNSRIKYGEESVLCAKQIFPELEVYAIPFRYPISNDNTVEWVDVVFYNKGQHPIDLIREYKIGKPKHFPPFSGYFLADINTLRIPPMSEKGFRFSKEPNVLKIAIEFYLHSKTKRVKLTVFKDANTSSF